MLRPTLVAARIVLLLGLVVVAARPVPVAAQTIQTTVVIVRHAEPAPGPGNDPPLSPDGRRRGDDLAAALLDAGVTAILTSQFRRTRETAQKVATVLGLTPVAIPVTGTIEQHVNALAAAVRNHRGGTILVVGHSNTVPALLKALGGPELPNLCETTFDRLFVLGLTDGKALLTRSRYGAASADDGPRCP